VAAGLEGVNFGSYGSLGYLYDAGTSALAAHQPGSHKALLGLSLWKKAKQVCPDCFR
jgi:hypothetical protein